MSDPIQLRQLLFSLKGKVDARSKRPWFDLSRTFNQLNDGAPGNDGVGGCDDAVLRKVLERYHFLLSDRDARLLRAEFPSRSGGDRLDWRGLASTIYPEEGEKPAHVIKGFNEKQDFNATFANFDAMDDGHNHLWLEHKTPSSAYGHMPKHKHVLKTLHTHSTPGVADHSAPDVLEDNVGGDPTGGTFSVATAAPQQPAKRVTIASPPAQSTSASPSSSSSQPQPKQALGANLALRPATASSSRPTTAPSSSSSSPRQRRVVMNYNTTFDNSATNALFSSSTRRQAFEAMQEAESRRRPQTASMSSQRRRRVGGGGGRVACFASTDYNSSINGGSGGRYVNSNVYYDNSALSSSSRWSSPFTATSGPSSPWLAQQPWQVKSSFSGGASWRTRVLSNGNVNNRACARPASLRRERQRQKQRAKTAKRSPWQ